MSYLSATLIVLLSASIAAGASRMVWRVLHLETRQRHHDAGAAFFLQLGVLFAVLLAFVFSEVWGEYNTASQAINGECRALHGASIIAQTLPPDQGQAMNRAIAAYTDTVVAEEWPLMADRHASAKARQAMMAMLQTAARLAVPGGDGASKAQILSLLADAHAQRETRLFQMTQGLPVVLWLVLSVYTAFLIGCVLCAGVESAAGHAIFAGAFTFCVVMVLVVVRMLDYPFEGALALHDGDFVKVSGEVSAVL